MKKAEEVFLQAKLLTIVEFVKLYRMMTERMQKYHPVEIAAIKKAHEAKEKGKEIKLFFPDIFDAFIVSCLSFVCIFCMIVVIFFMQSYGYYVSTKTISILALISFVCGYNFKRM